MKKLTEMTRNELLSQATQLARALDTRKNLGKEHDRLLKELKAERKLSRELAAKLRKQEIESAEQQAKICTAISEATVYEAQIADLESRLADVSKAESGGKVDGVFEVGDEVVYSSTAGSTLAWQKRDGMIGVIKKVSRGGTILSVLLDGEVAICYPCSGNLRHAAPTTTCESCTAKQERIEELEKVAQSNGVECTSLHGEIARLKKDAHHDWIKSDRTDVELYNEKLASEELRTRIANQSSTIESYAADRVEMQNRIALDKSSILRLTRELSAALLGGGE